jgi:hypothetical protein
MEMTNSKQDSQTNDTHYGQQGISRIQKEIQKNSTSSTKQSQTKSSLTSNSNIQKPFQSSTCQC